MNPPDDKENELMRRERELEDRERSMRLREIEAELDRQNKPEAPLYETKKYETSPNSFKRFQRNLVKVAKFFGFVIVVVVAVKIAQWLVFIITIGGIAWLGYELFIKSDRSF
jgi:hypothetical protein